MGGAPFQNAKRDVDIWQIGASIMHVPSGLWFYGMWQEERNHGTKLGQPFDLSIRFPALPKMVSSPAQNENEVWFLKAGIKRMWTPLGATVVWGEYGQYQNQYAGMCGSGPQPPEANSTSACFTYFQVKQNAPDGDSIAFGNITGSEVRRSGLGIVQEIDSAAMHLFARWQHLELDVDGTFATTVKGKLVQPSFDDLDIFQLGGVIFF